MDSVTLQARKRTETGKGPSRRLRQEGFIPSVTYKQGVETLSLVISREDLRGILKSDLGMNTLIELQVEGDATYPVMVKEYTIHPLTRQLLHADFRQVDVNEPVEVLVPFRRQGRSKGEVAGGTLLQTVRQLHIRCVPSAVPPFIDIDVSHLEVDDVMRVQDLTLPEGFEVLNPSDQKLVVVKPPRVEETPAEAEGEGVEGEGVEGAEGAEGTKDEGAKDEGAKDEAKDDAKK